MDMKRLRPVRIKRLQGMEEDPLAIWVMKDSARVLKLFPQNGAAISRRSDRSEFYTSYTLLY